MNTTAQPNIRQELLNFTPQNLSTEQKIKLDDQGFIILPNIINSVKLLKILCHQKESTPVRKQAKWQVFVGCQI